jgi:hypothetical protein
MQLTLRLTLVGVMLLAAPSTFGRCERCSPDGRYHLADRTNNGRPELAVIDENGSSRQVLTFADDDPANAILRAGWRNERVVWAEAHVNPFNGIYYEWDATNGHILRSIPESAVAVSPDGTHVAWVDVVAVHPAPDADTPALAIDEASRVVDVHGKVAVLAWSPDSDELAAAVESPQGARVMLFTADSRQMTRSFSLDGAARVRNLHWDATGLTAKTEKGSRTIVEPHR